MSDYNPPTLHQPLSEQVRIAGEDWVQKNSVANRLEQLKSAMLNQKKAALGNMADNKAERIVKADKEWTEYIIGMVEARRVADLAKVRWEDRKNKFTEWNNSSANYRAEMKSLGHGT